MKKIICVFLFLASFQLFAYEQEWSDLELGQNYILGSDLFFENGAIAQKGFKYTLVDMIPGGAGFPYMFMEFFDANCVTPEITADHGILMMKDSNNRDYRVLIKMEKNCHLGLYVHGSKFYNISVFQ